jgi:SAM-dependent methyltransferase
MSDTMSEIKLCCLTVTPLPRHKAAGGLLALTGLTAERLAAAAPAVVVLPAVPQPLVLQAAAWARGQGARVVMDCHDALLDALVQPGALRTLAASADAFAAASPGLAALVKQETGRPAWPVGDPCLQPALPPRFAPQAGRPLQLLWFGDLVDLPELGVLANELISYAPLRAVHLAILGPVPEPLADSLRRLPEVTNGRLTVTVGEGDDDAVAAALAACDALLLPASPDDRGRLRSASRAVTAIRAGRLVIAAPQPALQRFESGLLADASLANGLRQAEQDQPAMAARIVAGQALVEQSCTTAAVAAQWQDAAAGALAAEAVALPAAPAPSAVKLNLGCGDKILPGYINCDALASRGQGGAVDVQCNITKPLPFADNVAGEILAVHVVEHIWRWQVADVLRDWRRVLQPGGRIVLECPNLLSAAMELVKNPMMAAGPGPEGQRSMWVFYGDPRWRDPLMNHCWGYTPQSLAALLAETGFVEVRQEPAQFKLREPRDMRIVGVKPG